HYTELISHYTLAGEVRCRADEWEYKGYWALPNKKLAIYRRIAEAYLVEDGTSINVSRAAYNQFYEEAFDIVREIVVPPNCRGSLCLSKGLERVRTENQRDDQPLSDQSEALNWLFDPASSELIRAATA
ncbi:MAG: hypothetical protein AB8E87_12560, partial [Prochlorococcus sp.]